MVFHWHITDFDIDALISFTSTTIDDFAVMLYFFSMAEMKQGNERSRQYVSVLVSFFIGYTIVGVTALLSLLFGLVLSKEYIALAGFIPLVAGIHKVYESLVEQDIISPCACCGPSAEEDDKKRDDERVYNPITTADDDSLDDDDLEAAGGAVQMKSLSPGNGKKSSKQGNTNAKRSPSSSLSEKSPHGNVEKRYHKSKESGGEKDKSRAKHGSSSSSSSKNASAVDDEGDQSDWSSDDEYDICGPVQESIDSMEDKILGMFSAEQFRRHYRDPINWEVLMITLASGSDHVVIYVRRMICICVEMLAVRNGIAHGLLQTPNSHTHHLHLPPHPHTPTPALTIIRSWHA